MSHDAFDRANEVSRLKRVLLQKLTRVSIGSIMVCSNLFKEAKSVFGDDGGQKMMQNEAGKRVVELLKSKWNGDFSRARAREQQKMYLRGQATGPAA